MQSLQFNQVLCRGGCVRKLVSFSGFFKFHICDPILENHCLGTILKLVLLVYMNR